MAGIIFLLLGFFSKYEFKLLNINNNTENIVFILDISNSMNVTDVTSNYGLLLSRLDLAKEFIRKFIENNTANGNTKYGLIIFAYQANWLIPPTLDYTNLLTFLSSINSNNLPNFGSNLLAGMEIFCKYSTEHSQGILITDGGEKNDIDQAKLKEISSLIQQKDLNLQLIGIGTTQGDYVKYADNTYLTVNNQKIISARNDTNLNILNQGMPIAIIKNNLDFNFILNKLGKSKITNNIISNNSKLLYFGLILLILSL